MKTAERKTTYHVPLHVRTMPVLAVELCYYQLSEDITLFFTLLV